MPPFKGDEPSGLLVIATVEGVPLTGGPVDGTKPDEPDDPPMAPAAALPPTLVAPAISKAESDPELALLTLPLGPPSLGTSLCSASRVS